MKHYFLLFSIVFFITDLQAQDSKVALNVYGGYTFKDKVNFDNFYGYVEDAFQYGGGLEFFLQKTKSIEIKYIRMDTHFPLNSSAGTKLNEGKDKGSVNYILVGGNNYFVNNSSSKVIPFAGADLGVGIVDIKDGGNATKFAWDLKLGIKINTTSALSFKLNAYLQSIIAAVGTDFYVTGGGVIISVPDYVSLFQFGLGGAVCLNFNSGH